MSETTGYDAIAQWRKDMDENRRLRSLVNYREQDFQCCAGCRYFDDDDEHWSGGPWCQLMGGFPEARARIGEFGICDRYEKGE